MRKTSIIGQNEFQKLSVHHKYLSQSILWLTVQNKLNIKSNLMRSVVVEINWLAVLVLALSCKIVVLLFAQNRHAVPIHAGRRSEMGFAALDVQSGNWIFGANFQTRLEKRQRLLPISGAVQLQPTNVLRQVLILERFERLRIGVKEFVFLPPLWKRQFCPGAREGARPSRFPQRRTPGSGR